MFLPSGCESRHAYSWARGIVTKEAESYRLWSQTKTHTLTETHTVIHTFNKYSWAPGATAYTHVLPLLYRRGRWEGGNESSTESKSHSLLAWKTAAKIGNSVLRSTVCVVILNSCRGQRIPKFSLGRRKHQNIYRNFSNDACSIIRLLHHPSVC